MERGLTGESPSPQSSPSELGEADTGKELTTTFWLKGKRGTRFFASLRMTMRFGFAQVETSFKEGDD
jgi:hypothetical protein